MRSSQESADIEKPSDSDSSLGSELVDTLVLKRESTEKSKPVVKLDRMLST